MVIFDSGWPVWFGGIRFPVWCNPFDAAVRVCRHHVTMLMLKDVVVFTRRMGARFHRFSMWNGIT